MSCQFTASEIVLIIGACGALLTGVMISLKQSLKHSTCCGNELEFKDDNPKVSIPESAPVAPTPSPSVTTEHDWANVVV